MLLLTAAVFQYTAAAQSIIEKETGGKVSGVVKDKKDGQPLPGVFVSALSDGTLTGYAMSDGDGSFTIHYNAEKHPDELRASLMGYSVSSVSLTGKAGSSVTILLEAKEMVLKAAIKTGAAIEENGDTLSYTAQAFSDGTELAAADLLEKIPGISVTNSGGLLYGGRYISKFYVEGMDLMGNRYGIVTKNLKADDIARIEVYRHHQPKRILDGIMDTDDNAINIVLKDDAKGRLLFSGDLALGAPEFPLVEARAMLSNFSKTRQGLYLLKGNNVGTDINSELREQAYFGKTGAFRIDMSNFEPEMSSVLNPRRRRLSIPEQYWYDNLSGIASLNSLKKLSDDATVKISLQEASERYRETSGNRQEIMIDGQEPLVITEDHTMQEKRHYLNLSASIEKNSRKIYLSDEVSAAFQLCTDTTSSFGSGRYDEHYVLPSLKISNLLNATFRTSGNRAVTLKSDSRYFLNDHSANFATDSYSASQAYRRECFRSNNNIEYTLRIMKSSVSLNAGADFSYNGISSRLEGLSMAVSDRNQDMAIWEIEPFASVSGKVMFGKASLRYGLPFYVDVISARGSDTHIIPHGSPYLHFSLPISNMLEFTASSSFTSYVSGPESLMDAYTMSSYRTLSRADSLGTGSSVTADAKLQFSDNISMWYAHIGYSFRKQTNSRTTAQDYTDNLTLLSYIPVSLSSDGMSVSASVKKFFGLKTLVVELSAIYGYDNTADYLQGILKSYTNINTLLSMNVSTNPARWISAGLKCSLNLSEAKDIQQSKAAVFSADASLDIFPVKDFTIYSKGHYLRERIPGLIISNRPLVDIGLSRRFESLITFLECRNILNCTEYRRDFLGAYSSISGYTALRGIEILAGVRMSL